MVDEVDLDGEIVAFDGTSVHHLAGPAAAVWRLADGTLTAVQIAEVLADAYDVDRVEALRRVDDVVGDVPPARPCWLTGRAQGSDTHRRPTVGG